MKTVIRSSPAEVGLTESSRLNDPRVTRALDEYLAACEAGRQPDRQQFLDRFLDVKDELAHCLDGLDFVRQIAPQLRDESSAGVRVASSAPHTPPTLGDYRIVRELGRGGMGVVYEAEQLSLDRRVALKVLPFAAMLDQRQLQRFKNEARAAATLHHPHIVPVFSVGTERGVHYYAMQLIEGHSMASVIQKLRDHETLSQKDGCPVVQASPSTPSSTDASNDKAVVRPHGDQAAADAPNVERRKQERPPVGSAAETRREEQAALLTSHATNTSAYFRGVAELGIQAANALDHAHNQGVVHRDIKPANLLLDPEGQLWVTDFGLARLENDAEMTMSGDLVGTLRYMSPEQALAKRVVVDHRTDIYSLGVTLYELLTLRPAFEARDRQELLRQIAFEEPRAAQRMNKLIPQELATVVMKAMSKNAAERYATAQELADDLSRFLEDKPILATPPTLLQHVSKWCRRHRAIVTTAAVMLVMITALASVSAVLLARKSNELAGALANAHEQRRLLDRKSEELSAALNDAHEQRRRAEDNFRHAREAVDRVVVNIASELYNVPQMTKVRVALLKDAVDFYRNFLKQKGTDPEVRHDMAQRLLEYGNNLGTKLGYVDEGQDILNEAIENLKQLATEFPDEPSYRSDLANGYYLFARRLDLNNPEMLDDRTQMLQEAIDIYQRLAAAEPDRSYYRLASAKRCADIAQAFLSVGGRNQEAEMYYRKSLAEFELLKSEFPDYIDGDPWEWSQTYSGLAELLIREHRLADAEYLLHKAITTRQRLVDERPLGFAGGALVSLAYCNDQMGKLLLKKDMPEAAAEFFRQAIANTEKAVSNFPYRRPKLKHYIGLADALARMGRCQEAEKTLKQSIGIGDELLGNHPRKKVPDLALANYRLGLLLHDNDRPEEASDLFRTVLEAWNHRVDELSTWRRLAEALATCPATGFQHPQRAVELATKAVKRAREPSQCWHILGMAQYRNRNFRAAADAVQKSIGLRRDGGTSQHLYYLAMAYHQLGRQLDAKEHFEKAVAWMNDHADTNQHLRKEFQRLHSEAAQLIRLSSEGAPQPVAKQLE